MEHGLYRFVLIAAMAFLIGIAYFGLIRPRLRRRKAINETREWMFKQLGVMDTNLSKLDDLKDISDSAETVTDIRESWGYPPKQECVIEEIYAMKKAGSDWDYAVHIHEGSEQYLGSTIFGDLQNRFASIPGVDKCLQEDREVFLVKTRTLDAEKLRSAFWHKFLEAAKEVFDI